MNKKYSKKMRAQFVAALREAKTRLDNGSPCMQERTKETYICAALGHDSVTAQQVIMHRLRRSAGASGTVVGFLATSGIPPKLLTHRNVQEYRHRWVDALIEEFS
jgi:hypothetical protein